MAPRSTWKGFLKLNLVSVPVKAYSATSSSESIHLNQLHAECNSRINYKKTCPIHGEVSQSDIVSGYEFAKGQYVVIDTEELDKLRSEDDKAIKIDVFMPPDALDPIYMNGRSYYLVPDGPVAQKAYAVVLQAMVDLNRYAIAQVVLNKKEQTVLLRPVGNLITMSILNYENEVTKPAAFEDEVHKGDVSPDELELAKTLVKAQSKSKLEFTKYKDVYTERLTQLIEAKVAGKELVAAPVSDQPHIINLMDALRQSVAQAQSGETPQVEEAATGTKGARPPRKVAPSKKPAGDAAKRKRKSS